MNDTKRSEETLFEALSQLPAPERKVALDEACGRDAALRERLELLLAAHDRASGFMAEPVAPAVPGNGGLRIPVPERLGDQIGRYKLLQQIGEGGCGVVYMAEQEEPVRRRVAIKVIKLGMDTRQVIARFEAERQALALMDHPNIAKVLDAGASETGRPYFVMELVRGAKITEYCDQNNVPVAGRLYLFIKVCQAVQHAHQKGIIHRDLKPSNVLVTLHDGVPVPKVIDFGVAKATSDQRLTDKTVFTAFEQFIGTPAYMSPEQAEMSGLDLDTRSDIYSLGVLLYELLTSRTPFEMRELVRAGLDELRRKIREQEPLKPSTRLRTMVGGDLATVAKSHAAEPPKLINLVRGDLDWIVMKALEKDRTRRYETADALAADVKRHLCTEPIVARPLSRIYRVQKLVRRNKVGVAAAGAVAAAVLAGLGLSLWMFTREKAARQNAVTAQRQQASLRQEAEEARAREAELRAEAESNRDQAETSQVQEAKLREYAESAQKKAELARKKAEAGETALLYWQAFNALPALSGSERAFISRFGSTNQSREVVPDSSELLALAARYDKIFKLLNRAAAIRSGCDWAVNLADGRAREDALKMSAPAASTLTEIAQVARFRAEVALSVGRPGDASQDLLGTFALFRNLASDGTLRDVTLQAAAESQTVQFVASNFGRFDMATLAGLQQGIEEAPARGAVSGCIEAERMAWPDWLSSRAQEILAAANGNDAEALPSVKRLLGSAMGFDDAQSTEIIQASGGTVAGLLAYAKETLPFYSMMEDLARESAQDLAGASDHAEQLINGSSNLILRASMPNFGKARRRELEALTRLEMLRAAIAYKEYGLPGLNNVSDPFGTGPFLFRPITGGFELRSKIQDYGLDGSQAFLDENQPQ